MAFAVLVIDIPNKTIDQINADLMRPAKPADGIVCCADLLAGLAAKIPGANVQVTSRDTDPSVSTSGADSQQLNYNNK
jgi:hypothetical protein